MIKTKVISDIHLEFLNQNLNKVDRLFNKLFAKETQPIDVLFLAGDICSLTEKHLPKLYRFLELIVEHIEPREIYYVFGNHEYYGLEWFDDWYLTTITDRILNLSSDKTHIFVSGKGPLAIDYQNVFMSTLWYKDVPDVWLLQDNMSDFSEIGSASPQLFTDIYEQTVRLLHSYTKETRPDYWIFHHLPSWSSITGYHKTDRLNCYYVGDIADLILELEPRMVVHGHSHTPVEYWLGKTLVKSNPIGYPR